MNQKILFICLLLLSKNSFATQWSVSNSPHNPGQYTTINAAIVSTAVVNGDTLLIQAGAQYAAFSLAKSLVMIGAGFNPNKDIGLVTDIAGITLGDGSNGSKFYGIRINSVLTSGTTPRANIVYENCYFTGPASFLNSNYPENLFVKNCIIVSNFSFGSNIASSAIVTNCLLVGSISFGFSLGSLSVSHCTFSGGGSVNNCSLAVFQNNIFQGVFISQINNCVFNNNLTYSTTPTTNMPSSAWGVGNTGVNNIQNANPLFVNNAVGSIFLINTTNNHLQATSPALLASTTGGEIGVYGNGSTFSLKGEPYNTSVTRRFNINNAVVPVNSNLSINLLITNPSKQ